MNKKIRFNQSMSKEDYFYLKKNICSFWDITPQKLIEIEVKKIIEKHKNEKKIKVKNMLSV